MLDVEDDFLVVGSEGGQPKQTKRAGRWALVHVTAYQNIIIYHSRIEEIEEYQSIDIRPEYSPAWLR